MDPRKSNKKEKKRVGVYITYINVGGLIECGVSWSMRAKAQKVKPQNTPQVVGGEGGDHYAKFANQGLLMQLSIFWVNNNNYNNNKKSDNTAKLLHRFFFPSFLSTFKNLCTEYNTYTYIL